MEIDVLYQEGREFIDQIIEKKYLIKNEKTYGDVRKRHIEAFKKFGVNEEFLVRYKDLHKSRTFIPAGSVSFGFGNDEVATSLSNCYLEPIKEDSLEGIFDFLRRTARTYSYRGGVGTDITILRPQNTHVNNAAITSSGAVSFMPLISETTNTIGQNGRRGASLISLDCRHPDSVNFIRSKAHPKEVFGYDELTGKIPDVSYANISIKLTDDFMKAVEKDRNWTFFFPDTSYERYDEEWDGDYDKWIEKGYPTKKYQTIKARELMKIIAESAWADGCPGVIYIDTMRNNSTGLFDELLKIHGTNPCVTGDTTILTEDGNFPIIDLVGKKVKVWNGSEFSEVEPFSTGINNLYEIKLSNGSVIRCTDYHEFPIIEGSNRNPKKIRKQAKDLQVGEKLEKFDFPVLKDGERYDIDAYSQGFYSGDGYTGKTKSHIYHTKFCVMDRLIGTFGPHHDDRINWNHGHMLDKSFVPINGDLDYKLNWLAGILDSDGTALYEKNSTSFQITSIDKNFLNDIRLMLVTLGVSSKVALNKKEQMKSLPDGKGGVKECQTQDCYRLSISGWSVMELTTLGLVTTRLLIKENSPDRNALRNITIESVKNLNISEETFCFTEEKQHLGTFDGTVLAQCGEQPMAYHNNCMLSVLNLIKYVKNPFTEYAEFDYERFASDTRFGIEILDTLVTDNINRHPLVEQRNADAYSRRVGLELTGIADAASMLGFKYTSEEAKEVYKEVAKTKAKNEILASLDLSIKLGSCPALKTKESRILFLDQPYMKKVIDLMDDPEVVYNQIIEHGLRNTNWGSFGPTGTVSIIADNCSSGIEPIFNTEYIRKSKIEGVEPTRIFHFPILKHAKENDIDLTEMDQEEIKEFFNYEVSHEIKAEDRIEIQSIWQEYCDTSISSTVNLPFTSTVEDVENIYIDGWKKELKGITVFRDGSKTGVLSLESSINEKEKVKVENLSRELVRKHFELSKDSLHKDQDAKRIIEYWKGVKVYVTVTLDENGQPVEIFTKLPNDAGFDSDGNYNQELHNERSGQFDAICRLTSLLLRAQAPHEELIKQLERSSFSMFDIAGTVVRVLRKFDFRQEGEELKMKVCPECKEETLVPENGCDKCISCGFSKCG